LIVCYAWSREVDQQSRQERLKADRAALDRLAASSSIFLFATEGDALDRYVLSFRGKGLARDAASQNDVAIAELHQVELRMPYAYPTSPPDIRWLTPLWHPNVSFSGFVNLSDLGLTWGSDLPIDVVCERLWDIARGAVIHQQRATNYAAKNWFDHQNQFQLP